MKKNGYEILKMNYSCRRGEVDIVAREGEYIVFTEVKYRRGAGQGMPAEAVDARKRRRLCMAALSFLNYIKAPVDTPVRFDVVSILGNEITVIKNAFDFEL